MRGARDGSRSITSGRHALIRLPVVLSSRWKNDSRLLPTAMAISFLLLFAVPGCFSCNARIVPANRAKVVEEYVVSANFDSSTNFPQLSDRSHYQEDRSRGVSPFAPSFRSNHRDEGEHPEAIDHRTALEERDYLVHHHHLPPVAHPPPPPVALAHAPSLFAVGLITFLILLNSLQTSLIIMKSKGSVLSPGILGRRKRFVSQNLENFLEKYENATGNTSF